jgi:hypothetical protein
MASEHARALHVAGLDCAEGIATLRREVGPLVGGEAMLGFDLLRGRMTVSADAVPVPDVTILAAAPSPLSRRWRSCRRTRCSTASSVRGRQPTGWIGRPP